MTQHMWRLNVLIWIFHSLEWRMRRRAESDDKKKQWKKDSMNECVILLLLLLLPPAVCCPIFPSFNFSFSFGIEIFICDKWRKNLFYQQINNAIWNEWNILIGLFSILLFYFGFFSSNLNIFHSMTTGIDW